MRDMLLRRAVKMDDNHMTSVSQLHKTQTYEYLRSVEEQLLCLDLVASSMDVRWASLRGPTNDDGIP